MQKILVTGAAALFATLAIAASSVPASAGGLGFGFGYGHGWHGHGHDGTFGDLAGALSGPDGRAPVGDRHDDYDGDDWPRGLTASPQSQPGEHAIQDLEAVKDGIRDY